MASRRWYLIVDQQDFGAWVVAELGAGSSGGLIAEFMDHDQGSHHRALPERDAQAAYPEALAAWRRRDDTAARQYREFAEAAREAEDAAQGREFD